MARPNKPRNVKSFTRDVETLARLRTSVLLDKQVEETLKQSAVNKIDEVIDVLLLIVRVKEGSVS